MSHKITRKQAEQILKERFYGKNCSFEYPGYKTVYGMVDQVAIEDQEIIIQINGKRYTCSPEALNECLTLLNNNDGDHTRRKEGDAGRLQQTD